MNIKEYYKKYVEPLHPRFQRYSFETSKTVVCPLHNDHDPSMGVLPERGKKPERYHCFGCGKWGDVVDIHMQVFAKYKGVHLSRSEAAKELGIEENTNLPTDRNSELEDELISRSTSFSVGDFERVVKESLSVKPKARAMLLQDAWIRAYRKVEE